MKMTKWKWIFVIALVTIIYFAFGIAQKGQNTGFFVGLVSGTIVCYLFLRAKDEAVANANTNINSQNVNLTLNQQRLHMNGGGFTEEQITQIAAIVETIQEHKLVVPQNRPQLANSVEAIDYDQFDNMTNSEQLAYLLRKRRNNA